MVKNLILQSVGNHQNHPCQLWYLLLTPIPKHWTNLGRGNFFYNSGKDICMKFEPRSKRIKRNTTRSKKFDINVLSANYNIIVICQVFNQFGAIRKPDFRRIVHELSIFISIDFLTKTENTTKKLQHIAHAIHSKIRTSLVKNLFFCKECWRLNAKTQSLETRGQETLL